jgi:hypothetical protein
MEVGMARVPCDVCGKTRLCAQPVLTDASFVSVCERCVDELVGAFLGAKKRKA